MLLTSLLLPVAILTVAAQSKHESHGTAHGLNGRCPKLT